VAASRKQETRQSDRFGADHRTSPLSSADSGANIIREFFADSIGIAKSGERDGMALSVCSVKYGLRFADVDRCQCVAWNVETLERAQTAFQTGFIQLEIASAFMESLQPAVSQSDANCRHTGKKLRSKIRCFVMRSVECLKNEHHPCG